MTTNSRSTFATLGARNHGYGEYDGLDYYATDPRAVQSLLKMLEECGIVLTETVMEPAIGGGHIADVLLKNGHNILGIDVVDRGYQGTNVRDFLADNQLSAVDIITNPPYGSAEQFVLHALDIIKQGRYVIMLLRIQFLEGINRYKQLYSKELNPQYVYVFSKRTVCSKNGQNFSGHGASCYAWFVWKKGYRGETVIRWIGPDEINPNQLTLDEDLS